MNPSLREYDEYGQQRQPAAGNPAAGTPAANGSPLYLIAFRDHSIRAAAAYWLDGRTLRWESMRRAGVPPQRWDAALDAAAAQALRQALDEATR